MVKPIIVIVGAQFGSEAKGAVASALGKIHGVRWAVRTGAVNAGHTVYHAGRPWVMQQLPVGWTNPETKLVIGPGALVHPDILMKETEMLMEADPRILDRIYIDKRAGIHLGEHTKRAGESGRHHAMGATGKGCSEALVDRIRLRGKGGHLFKDSTIANQYRMVDTVELLHGAYDSGNQILLEGTQGSGLDLYLGPYPYTTHKQTTAANWVAEAGLSPAMQYEVVLVARTYPIRVAGNSGPLKGEVSWTELAHEVNRKLALVGKEPRVKEESLLAFRVALHRAYEGAKYPVPLNRYPDPATWTDEDCFIFQEAASELHRDALALLPKGTVEDLRNLFELTTVTKKLRRVADISLSDLHASCRINRPAYLVLTFMNYVVPEAWGMRRGKEWREWWRGTASEGARGFVKMAEEATGTPVRYVTFGPEDENMVSLLPSAEDLPKTEEFEEMA